MTSTKSRRARQQQPPPAVLRRTGLHRLECEQDCGAYVYATVANLEQHQLPTCSCGARLIPEGLELALHLLPAGDEHRDTLELAVSSQVSRSARGQMRATGAGHRGRSAGRDLDSPELLAARALEQRRRADAHQRRVSGLRRGALDPSTVQVDSIPF